MINNKDLLQWWLDKDPLTEEEFLELQKGCVIEKQFVNDLDYLSLTDEYFKHMPFCNITSNNYQISFSDAATKIINKLFEEHVDDNTLVITSNNEHDSVKACVKECKNVLTITHEEDIVNGNYNKILFEAKKYNKVFVYIIGTQISNGKITPQTFFRQLKAIFVNNNIEHIFVIDDVHGMFIVPRDYSLFDYIVFTAHALVLPYNMGMLISKKNLCKMESIYNWGKDYLKPLNIILKRQEKLRMFGTVLSEYFYDYLKSPLHHLSTNTAPHIFSVTVEKTNFNQQMYDLLKPYHIRIEGLNSNKTFLRFRAGQYIYDKEALLKGLDLLEELLKLV